MTLKGELEGIKLVELVVQELNDFIEIWNKTFIDPDTGRNRLEVHLLLMVMASQESITPN